MNIGHKVPIGIEQSKDAKEAKEFDSIWDNEAYLNQNLESNELSIGQEEESVSVDSSSFPGLQK